MSKKEKLIKRLKSRPKDFTYNEMKTLLKSLGFDEISKGKTSGSRVAFASKKLNGRLLLHKPHPKNILKDYQIKEAVKKLKEWGVIE